MYEMGGIPHEEAIPLKLSFIRYGHRLRHTCEREVAA